jgi:hypothetical protein
MSDNLFSNWVIENCSTVGTGVLNLSGALGVNQSRFRDALNSGDVYYSLTSGADRECGIGAFNGTSTITRETVKATLVNGVYNDSSPAPLSLEGAAIVSCTLNADLMHQALDDIAQLRIDVDINTGNIISIGGDNTALEIRVSQNETDISTNVTDIAANTVNITANADAIAVIDDDLSYREVSITALEAGGLITQNGNTAILVAAGNGEIINSYDDTENQATEEISWLEQTFDLLANTGMPIVTGLGYTTIGLETNGSGTGIVKAYPGGINSAQRKIVVVLGQVEYVDQIITDVAYAPIVSNQIGNTLMDLIDFVEAGSKIKGMVLRPTDKVAPDLSIWRDAGEIFSVGSNYEDAKDNQNVSQIAAAGSELVGVFFNLTSFNNGTTGIGASVDLVPPDAYEPDGAGTISLLPNGTTVIHYILEATTGSRFMSYGQQTYSTHADAISNLFADRAAHLFPVELGQAFLLGQIVIDKDAAVWGGFAEIFPLDSATSSGSSSGAASQAVNVSYSDTFNLGNNVQSALDTLAGLKLTPDQLAAVQASQAPSAVNEFITAAVVADNVTNAELNLAIGNINSPLMDLPLDNSLAMKQGVGNVDFARASTATYIDRYGAVQTAQIDEPRFEKEGLLIEGASTNDILFSQDFNDGNWAKVNTTVLSSTILAPDGTNTAYEISVNAESAYIQQTATFAIGETYTASGFIKKSTSTLVGCGIGAIAGITLDLDAGTITDLGNTTAASLTPIGDGWFRWTATGVASGTSHGVRPLEDNAVITSPIVAYIWGVQLEELPFASSYQLTTTVAVTREGDMCDVTFYGNGPLGSKANTIAIDFVHNGIVTSFDKIIQIDEADYRAIRKSSSTQIRSDYGGADSIVTVPINQVVRLVDISDDTDHIVYINGAELGRIALQSDSTTMPTRIALGYNIGSGSQYLWGHLSNFRLYDFALTPTEVGLA